MLKFEPYGLFNNVAEFRVDMNSMQSVISANLEWKDFSRQKYNPFEKLFDLKEVQASANYDREAYLYPMNIRCLFAKYAKSKTAMTAIDVAILRWSVQ